MKTRNNPVIYLFVLGLVLISSGADAQKNKDDLLENEFLSFISQWSLAFQEKLNNSHPVLSKQPPVFLEVEKSVAPEDLNSKSVKSDFFQPTPVILGVPEYPIKEKVDSKVNSPYLHQAIVLKLIVLSADGRSPTIQNLSYAIKPTDRFKIRLTSMFDAWVSMNQILPVPNNSWVFKNSGQVFPQLGSAILLKKDSVIDLPSEPVDYFQLEDQLNEKIVLRVRHEQSKKDSVNQQPIYRRDYDGLSAYVQLVPPGKFPIFEQVISLHHN